MSKTIRYKCAGSRFSRDEVKKEVETLSKAADEYADAGVEFPERHAKTLDRAIAELNEMNASGSDLTRRRRGCGADTTDLINAIPADGIERPVVCPKCGEVSFARTEPAATASTN